MSKQLPLPLFGLKAEPLAEATYPVVAPPVPQAELDEASTLHTAIAAYIDHRTPELAQESLEAHGRDLNRLGRFVGFHQQVDVIGTDDLRHFFAHIEAESSPATVARRLGTVRTFFDWLCAEGAICESPAQALHCWKPRPTLPDVLSPEEVKRLLEATRRMREQGDPRPDFLARLFLHSSMKRGEAMRLRVGDLHLDRDPPQVVVRYGSPRRRHKERVITLPSKFREVAQAYLDEYRPTERVLECTERTVTNVLQRAGEAAGLETLSVRRLRWTGALHDFISGIPEEKLRRKLGLSGLSWAEMRARLQRLVG